MGLRGKTPLPHELKVVQGSKRLNPDPSTPTAVTSPEPPCELEADARKIWDEMTDILERSGVLTEADLFLVARYCAHRAEWIRLESDCRKHGDFVDALSNKGHKYFAKRWQAVRRDNLESSLTRIERELGLSPASRGGMTIRKTPKKKDSVREGLYG